MKKILFFLLCVTLLALSCSALTGETAYLKDEETLFSLQEREELNRTLDRLYQETGNTYVIATSSEWEVPENFAKSVFRKACQTLAHEESGGAFLFSVTERTWAFEFFGSVEERLDDAFLDQMEANVKSKLSLGDYFGACKAFSADCESLSFREAREPSFDLFGTILSSVIFSAIVALVSVWAMRLQLKSRRQRAAGAYAIKDSFQLSSSHDLYLYSTVSRTPRPKNHSSSGSGGSGRSGRSGRF